MELDEREQLLADCLCDHDRRQALGEASPPHAYRERLGEAFTEFESLVETSDALRRAVDPPGFGELPRPFGRYTLTRRLGQGAMGVVFEAIDGRLGRRVALKVLRSGFDLDGTSYERFRREARETAQVLHPSVVTVHDAGAVDGQLYYTMDVVEGATLGARVKGGALPPLDRLLDGFVGLADGLAAVHAAGILHRDVKPSNVIVREDGTMVLADFGLARTALTETLTRTGETIGTLLYMPPEQVFGRREEVDERSDVYSLGATIYEALTGAAPIPAGDVPELLRRVATERPRAPGEARPDLPEGLGEVVLKALEKRPEDRYASAAAMRDDLRLVAAGRAPRGRPIGRARRAARWSLRRAPAFVALALVLGAGLFWWNRRPAHVVVLPLGWPLRVDGILHPATEAPFALEPGSHLVELVLPLELRDHLVVEPLRFEVEAGAHGLQQIPVSPVDDVGRLALLERADPAGARLRRHGTMRSGGGREILWPRGALRAEALDEWALAIAPEDQGRRFLLRFERDGTLLGEVEVVGTEEPILRGPMPPAVREASTANGGVRLSLATSGPKGIEVDRARFEVVAPGDLETRLAAAAQRAAPYGPAVASVVRARMLHAAGLHAEAVRAMRGVPREERGLVGWGVLEAAGAALQLASPDALEGATEEIERVRAAHPELYASLYAPE